MFLFKPKRNILKRSLYLVPVISGVYGLTKINEDFNYFLLGLRRGIRSLSIGALIIANYKIMGISTETHEYAARKLYKLFKRNSGSYIKLGQSLAQSEHILPEPFIRNMEPLCQEAPMTEISKVKKQIEQQLNIRFDDLFESFDEVPLGSASLAQVHKAKLRGSDEEVAIKVQHPMISVYCPSDVAIVKFATKVGEIIWPGVKLQWIAKEFDLNIMKEIDFRNEGANADRIRNLFKDDDRVVIPKVNWQYTSRKILTMSFEKGKSIIDTQYRLENKISVHELAQLMAEVFNRQIFEFGFVHSDPHHGNLFIRREMINGKSKLRLVILDHGLYQELDQEFKHYYAMLWRGVFMQKPEIINEACHGLQVKRPDLFIAIVTNKSYQEIMKSEFKYSTKKRLGVSQRNEENEKKIKEFIHNNIRSLTLTLDEMRSEMYLVLKINGFLRSIDKRIGNPINNFNIMIEYVYKEIMNEFKDQNKSAVDYLKLYYEYYSFKWVIWFMNAYYYLFFKSWNRREIENADLKVLL